VNLEGSLDAFGLPDVVALLASTGKSGGLMLRRGDADGGRVAGVVWFHEGRICGASSDTSRASLVRRIVGSGVVDDFALRQAVQRVASGGIGVARALLEAGSVEPELMRQAAADQVVDAVFDLLRWPDGDFGFDQSAVDVDDVGITLDHTRVLAEAKARADSWPQLEALVPSRESVLAVPVVLHQDPELSRDEWALMALVDGRRRVRDLVELTGAGEFAVTTTLAHLVRRGLVQVRDMTQPDHVSLIERRLALLAAIETTPVPMEPVADPLPASPTSDQQLPAGPGALAMSAAAALAAARAAQGLAQPGVPGPGQVGRPAARREVVPPRPEPFLPGRRPEHAEQPLDPAATRSPLARPPVGAPLAGSLGTSSLGSGPAGSAMSGQSVIEGSTARALSDPALVVDTVVDGVIERDPGVNRSLLLRLIAGVRGL
jgi:hypothetical protein